MTSTDSYENKLPDEIKTKLKSNIRNLFNCKRVCGVCLSITRNLRLGNTVYSISCGDNLSEKSLRNIMCSTFGYKVTSLLPTCYFCENCIDVILKAYRMLEEIKFNHLILQSHVNKLLVQTKMQLPDDVQSIVFELEYPTSSNLENHSNNITDSKINDDNSCASDDDDVSNNESLGKVESTHTSICKEEPTNMGYGEPIKLDITEILAKIKNEITFKKFKTEEPVPVETKETKKNIINRNTKKMLTKRKLAVKNEPVNKKLNITNETKDRYYKCYLCETTFTGESELMKHSRKLCIEPSNIGKNHASKISPPSKKPGKDDGSTKKEVCDQCGKLVVSNYLRKHKRLHERMQKQCPVCAQFINKSSYNKHMHMHSGLPKMRSCPDCDYESKWSEVLDAHINKQHLKIRPYTCDKCNKGFHSKMLLREHIKTHTRLKTEQCHLCGNRFAYKKSLMLHMRIHTGYAPYKCNLCSESFISASRRQAHVQTKHVGKTLQCDICLKKFSLRTTLRCHMRKIHQRKDKAKSDS